jgi:iron complex outermembrane receptor protein
MRIGIIPVLLMCLCARNACAQTADSLQTIAIDEVVVTGSLGRTIERRSAQPVEVVDEAFLHEHFTGNLTQALQHLPGVHSMSIGSGFSKPVIRGMGFNRISVTENGIKQEGQQWGADHGLEIDAFGVERVVVRKGPASLLYGSDAMGGVVEIMQAPQPAENQLFGEAFGLWRSVNGTGGGSLMLGVKKNAWYIKGRFSEQHFGDLHVPTDTVVYLTQRLPIAGRRLKNTAGFERDASGSVDYRSGRYGVGVAVSNAYQKVGFFAGAHGVPGPARLADDGDPRNIDLPYSTVNHLKISARQQYMWDKAVGVWNIGFQHNHRQEWSQFHTHYGTAQAPPAADPDKELEFSLRTFSSSVRLETARSGNWEHTAGWDIQYQKNAIGGYSFLLPEYERFTTGLLWLSEWRAGEKLSVTGGIRYDYGRLDAAAFEDAYLEEYLLGLGYDEENIARYRWRSYAVDRRFGDVSGSLGLVWWPGGPHTVKMNLGRGFRLPGANELASNGVHHGTFRHEQGDASLDPERGWQLDASYEYEQEGISLSVTPFLSWYGNYLYLQPTGQWSILPHAGQIYRYAGAEAVFAGAEVDFCIHFLRRWTYQFVGEYVYGRNLDERIPLPFSPPAAMHHTLTWERGRFRVYAEGQGIAPQRQVSRNEEPTPGAFLWNMGASVTVFDVELSLSAQNIFDTKYYDHLSFYRQAEIPEPGRNIQLFIKIPFKTNLK